MKVTFHIHMPSNHTANRKETIEIPDEDLERLSDEQRIAHIEQYFQDWLSNEVDYGWYEERDDDE